MSVLQVDQIRGRHWIIILVGPGQPSLMESPVRVGLIQVVDDLSYHSLLCDIGSTGDPSDYRFVGQQHA